MTSRNGHAGRRAGNRRALRAILLAGGYGFGLVTQSAMAQDLLLRPRNNYSRTGLIEMPSARMAPDGELSAGIGFTENIQHYNLGFQALPWLETGFHYSGLQKLSPAASVYFDRSFSAKLRLLEESALFPAIAVGFNDVVGTGIYGGEYVVASKQIGALDFTLGMGWGRMGSTAQFTNPLSILSDSFKQRPGTGDSDNFNDFGSPGTAAFKSFFRGPSASLFGGVAWSTPIEGLTLMAEYSSDAYTLETGRGTFSPRNQFNFGASYRAWETLSIGLSWLYGRSVAANFAFHVDPVKDPYPQRLGPPLPTAAVRTSEEQQQGLTSLRGAPRLASVRFASVTALADAMWEGDSDIRSIDLRGTSLFITLGGGDPQTVCRSKAALASGTGLAISQVEVAQGAAITRCPVSGHLAGQESPPRMTVLAPGPSPASFISIDARQSQRPSNAEVTTRIRRAAASQNLLIETIGFRPGEISVYYTNQRYPDEREAIERLTRILMAEAPPDIEKFRLVSMTGGVPQRQFEVLRAPLERDMEIDGAPAILAATRSSPAPSSNPDLARATRTSYPRFSWSLFPQFRQQLFDPVNPFGVQLLLAATGQVELVPGLSVLATAESSIYDDFNTARLSNSVLPHVRSDFVNYFSKGKHGIGQMEMNYRFRVTPSVYGYARAGYLESMFAGVGGELLWRPEGQRWALGVDLYQVWQRGFTRLFNLQGYNVLTGHVSLYYASPWHDLNLMLSAGRYLAGDTGITVQVTRRFASGVEIGAFMTRTNVSAADFGEGSFDKGIIIRIPLNFIAPLHTTSQFGMDLRPIQRDGGQRLAGDAILYEDTRPTSQAEMYLRSGGNYW